MTDKFMTFVALALVAAGVTMMDGAGRRDVQQVAECRGDGPKLPDNARGGQVVP